MIGSNGVIWIVVATRPVDFRKGHDGLAAVAEHELGLDPHSGVAVIFRSKSGDRLKLLLWDGTGLVLLYKRLEQRRFTWPTVRACMSLFRTCQRDYGRLSGDKAIRRNRVWHGFG